MNKKEFFKYLEEVFLFNRSREYAIYLYLCKKQVGRRQRKLIAEDVKFVSYKEWKKYIVQKYNRYTKDGLVEFRCMLNLLLRDSNKANNYIQEICVAYFSAAIAILLTEAVDSNKEGSVSWLIFMIILIPFIVHIIIKLYNVFILGSDEIHFYTDVKAIIEEMILSD